MKDSIRGEYWIEDGHVSFADMDVGDSGHEGIAMNAFCSGYTDAITSLVHELEKQYNVSLHDCDFEGYDGVDIESMHKAINAVEELLEGENIPNPAAYIAQHIGANNEQYQVLVGYGNVCEYMMKFENWIAVRGDNVELWGMNPQKIAQLKSGLEDILDQEGIPHNTYMEFGIYDHATKKSTSFNLGQKYIIQGKPLPPSKGLVKFNYPKGADKQQQMNKATGIPHYRTQESMDFKGWLLKEVGTTTACIAGFSRPVGIGVVKRKFPKRITNDI